MKKRPGPGSIFDEKQILSCESDKVPKTIVPSNLCILSQIRHFIAKTKLDTRPRSLQEPKMGKW